MLDGRFRQKCKECGVLMTDTHPIISVMCNVCYRYKELLRKEGEDGV